MYSVLLIRLIDIIPVTEFQNAKGVTPRSLLIKGQGFENIESVMIGGVPSPEFVAYSRNEILAQVPDLMIDQPISEVTVYAAALRPTKRSLLEFTVGVRPKKVRGILRLLQNYVRVLLRSPGTNAFRKNSGGGLRRRIGENMSQSASADVIAAVSRTTSYFLAVQARNANLPPSERLMSAEVEGVAADTGTGTLYVTISLMSHTGAQGTFNLAF